MCQCCGNLATVEFLFLMLVPLCHQCMTVSVSDPSRQRLMGMVSSYVYLNFCAEYMIFDIPEKDIMSTKCQTSLSN